MKNHINLPDDCHNSNLICYNRSTTININYYHKMKLLIISTQFLCVLSCYYLNQSVLDQGAKSITITRDQTFVDVLKNVIVEVAYLGEVPKLCTNNDTNYDLKNVFLRNTNTKELGVNLFSNYHLELFALTTSSVPIIRTHTFYNCSIVRIELNNCKIKTLEAEAFSDLRDLLLLNLDNNEIDVLRSNSFRNLLNLKKFMFNYNRLTGIHEHDLDFLKTGTVMEHLSFNNNLLEYLEIGSLGNLNVSYLSLKHNNLLVLFDQIFYNSSIEIVFVQHNFIKEPIDLQYSFFCDVGKIFFEPWKEVESKMEPEEINSFTWIIVIVIFVILLLIFCFGAFWCH